MTALDLDAIQARADAATAGPWKRYETMQADTFVVGPRGLLLDGAICGPTYDRENCEFIAQARTDVPALIAEVRRLSQRPTSEDIVGLLYDGGQTSGLVKTTDRILALFPDVTS